MLSYLDVMQGAALRRRLEGWCAHARRWIGQALRRIAGDSSKRMFFEFTSGEVARLHHLTVTPSALGVDTQTWNDLLLSSYHQLLAAQSSIFSQQILFRRLRQGMAAEDRASHARRIQALLKDEQLISVVGGRLHRLRNSEIEIATLLFADGELEPIPSWWPKARLLPYLVIVALSCGFILHTFHTLAMFAFASAGLLLMTQFWVRLDFDPALTYWTDAMASLRKLLLTADDLHRSNLPLTDALCDALSAAEPLRRALARFPLTGPPLVIRDMLDWFWLGRERHYVRQRRYIVANLACFQRIFYACSDLEADIVIASHLRDSNGYCWAGTCGNKEFALEQARHPLLTLPTPLSVKAQGKGLFISGQNGIGKSTLLRTISLNQASANSFGFCYALSATLPALPVFASMQNEDSLLEGQSLYISELTRARELMHVADTTGPAIYVIDEIFRGTNYLESVSAAAAFLNAISRHSLVFVSSHNLIRGAILAGRFDSVEIKRVGADGTLIVAPGILKETNGISLLTAHGFDERIEEDARQVHRWLSDYITSPIGGCPIVLQG